MKYDRMVCFLTEQEIKSLKEENKSYNISIIFAKNYKHFESVINNNSYNVISIEKANKELDKLQNLIKKFPNYQFHARGILDKVRCLTVNEIMIFEEKISFKNNIVIKNY